MPWNEVDVTTARIAFIMEKIQGKLNHVALCRKHSISSKTGYKCWNLFLERGVEGLVEGSRAPINHGRKTPDDLAEMIMMIKLEYPTWGPKKLRPVLVSRFPEIDWPYPSTMGNILDSMGLVTRRTPSRKVGPRTQPLAHAVDCNRVWCLDFKGWWKTLDGAKIEPFTITDAYSRLLIHSAPLPRNTSEYAWCVLAGAFREYGLPTYMRSDNGSPFASRGVGRLSQLGVLLVKAGVIPEWISPGKPQENGRHERMHRTLKREVASPPAKTRREQLSLLHHFHTVYNHERPHEALGQVPPASVYTTSPRKWAGELRSPDYPSDWNVLKVRDGGAISWNGTNLYVARMLTGEPIGTVEVNSGIHAVFYGPIFLGFIASGDTSVQKSDKRLMRRAESGLSEALKCYLCMWSKV